MNLFRRWLKPNVNEAPAEVVEPREQTPGATGLSPLVLAYLGDAVWELYIREQVVKVSPVSIGELHARTVSLVRAESQARLERALSGMLEPQEMAILRRGKNAKSSRRAKTATIAEYHRSTGWEALLGYTYLYGSRERLEQIMKLAYEALIASDTSQ
jgi:ribonuclease-3 family protein